MLGSTDGGSLVIMTVVVTVMTVVRVVVGRVDVHSVVNFDELIGITVMVGVVRSEVLEVSSQLVHTS